MIQLAYLTVIPMNTSRKLDKRNLSHPLDGSLLFEADFFAVVVFTVVVVVVVNLVQALSLSIISYLSPWQMLLSIPMILKCASIFWFS